MSTVRPHEKRVAAPHRNRQTRVIGPNAHAWNILALLTWLPYESDQAIVPFRAFSSLRSSYALDPQSMEETSE